MMRLTLKYEKPEPTVAKINMCWRDFAKQQKLNLADMLKFLQNKNFIIRYDITTTNEVVISRIEASVIPAMAGLTQTFFSRKKNGQHFSQSKLTPMGMKVLSKRFKKDFDNLRKGIPVDRVIDISVSSPYKSYVMR